MLETLYGGGLRVSELVGLNLDDLDAESDLVRVRGKGRRERLCPVGAMAAEWLRRWIALRQPKAPPGAGAVPEPAGDAADDPERRPAAGGAPAAGRPGRHGQSRIRSATASPPTCWMAAPTSAASRNCWAIAI